MKTIEIVGLNVTNYVDLKGQALLKLITKYIQGFSGQYYGTVSLGDQIYPQIPYVIVAPTQVTPVLKATGAKYEARFTYMVYFRVADQRAADAMTLMTSCSMALMKLLSNNALNDMGGANTQQFKKYPGFWIDSEMTPMIFGQPVKSPLGEGGEQFLCGGSVKFVALDEIQI